MRTSTLSWILLVVFSLLIQVPAEAKRRDREQDERRSRRDRTEQVDSARVSSNDADLVRAVQDRRYVSFVTASQVTVSKVMEDDTLGKPHQRWYVRLSSGDEVFCVYNLDMGKRVPLKLGDVISMGGEFKWTSRGALLHWLHHDPRNNRPDGFVEVGGTRYGLE